MEDLTPRKKRILQAVVIEYVHSAEPVPSNVIVERYTVGVGPATVRHELADMSERGYLEQPHTSAGRIPSDTGYRYYVDNLADQRLPEGAQSTIREATRSTEDLDNLLHETCSLLARLTHQVAIAATLRDSNATIRTISLIGVAPKKALLTVVFSTGAVETRIVDALPELTLQDLHDLGAAISESVQGMTIRSLSRAAAPRLQVRPSLEPMVNGVWKALKQLCRQLSKGKIYTEGTNMLLGQPEFHRDVGALADIVSALDNFDLLREAVDRPGEAQTAITIGRENPHEPLQRLAIIASRFYVNDQEAGSLAVMGPTRMSYETTVPLVQETAKALSQALSRLLD